MTAGGGTYLLEDRELEVRAGDFIYMAPYCPQSFVAGDEPVRVPALQGRLARRFLSRTPLVPSSRPLTAPIAPVDIPCTEDEKGKPVVRRGRKARGLRLGDGSAAGLLTTTSRNHAHARHHLTHRPPARRHPGAGAAGRAGARRRRAVHAALRADRARRHRRGGQHAPDLPDRDRRLHERAERHRRHAEQQQLEHGAGQRRRRRHRQLLVGHGHASRPARPCCGPASTGAPTRAPARTAPRPRTPPPRARSG